MEVVCRFYLTYDLWPMFFFFFLISFSSSFHIHQVLQLVSRNNIQWKQSSKVLFSIQPNFLHSRTTSVQHNVFHSLWALHKGKRGDGSVSSPRCIFHQSFKLLVWPLEAFRRKVQELSLSLLSLKGTKKKKKSCSKSSLMEIVFHRDMVGN